MYILVVTNPKAVDSIHVYSAACSLNLKNDVLAALLKLKIGNYDKFIDDIVNGLKHGNDYWIWQNDVTYCFSIICV